MADAPTFALTTGTVWQTLYAAADISANMVVMHSANGVVPFVPLASNLSLIAGVSTNATSAGGNSLAVSNGVLINGGDFTVGAYYAGADGVITQTPPTSGLVLQVGYAVNTDTLIINIQQPTQVSTVYSITTVGNGTTTYTNSLLMGASLLLVQTSGIGRVEATDYTFDNTIGTITFGSIIKTTQSIIILYS